MKLKARITVEVNVTKAEAEILVRNAEFVTTKPDTLVRMVDLILKKKFPNAGSGSYIPQE